ncbi:MAG: hypothetical protein IPI49_27240 [Myxococcales bacterium]|nr:hypothetical protein [Myxococcales bacterium]HRC54507.1 hypothetical protein [Kofleriaceae bacterium]
MSKEHASDVPAAAPDGKAGLARTTAIASLTLAVGVTFAAFTGRLGPRAGAAPPSQDGYDVSATSPATASPAEPAPMPAMPLMQVTPLMQATPDTPQGPLPATVLVPVAPEAPIEPAPLLAPPELEPAQDDLVAVRWDDDDDSDSDDRERDDEGRNEGQGDD